MTRSRPPETQPTARVRARSRRPGRPADTAVLLAATGVVVAAAVEGRRLLAAGVDIYLGFPPLLATWAPHAGPGSAAAVAVAALVVAGGPGACRRWRWRPLLLAGWVAAVAWTVALALVDGYQVGFAGRLATDQEYLFDLPLVDSVGGMLATFTDRMPTDQAVHWTTHVGGHPPGAFLVFVLLDRIGLGGGGAAAALCVLVGASVVPAIAVTLRALGSEHAARTMLPFAVLTPAAVWVGVSADGLFAGVLAWTAALVALACTRTGGRADAAALGAGLLGGYLLYLSYGLVLGGLLPAAVLVCARRARAVVAAGLGIVLVAGAFTAAGFWWFEGYRLVLELYHASIARTRPFGYFWWANLAALVFVVGPAGLVGLRRLVAAPAAAPRAVVALAAAAVLAMLVADLTGLSKGEVERIWLPFASWVVVACAVLPEPWRRPWLVVQVVSALAVNHLLLTVW